jgi:hypothetical protein
MKRIAFPCIALLLLSSSLLAQAPVDSGRYYQKQLAELHKAAHDSLYATATYRQLNSAYQSYQRRSTNYFSLMLVGEIMHNRYAAFNQSLALSGFPAMNPLMYRIGIGYSARTGNAHFDFLFGLAGIPNRSRKGDETVRASVTNVLQFDIGYSTLRGKGFSLYPFAGLSLRNSMLQYQRKGTGNASFTNITDISTNSQEITTNSNRLGYQAGLGLDILVGRNDQKLTRTIFFIKGGVNKPVWKDRYKVNGIAYQPNIDHGDWTLSTGLKLVSGK